MSGTYTKLYLEYIERAKRDDKESQDASLTNTFGVFVSRRQN